MSVNEEKLLVLKMLEEGKITSEEAIRLIEAIESGKKETETNYSYSYRQQKKVNFSDEISKVKDRL
ncbi:MAG: hypothetical protein GX660_09955, partial [Clostridiaceae bacterium]|nr:hypothetical protein [Clostridiaceae bacterium]